MKRTRCKVRVRACVCVEVLWCSGAVVRLFPALTPEAVAQKRETLSLGVITSQIKSETSVTRLRASTPPPPPPPASLLSILFFNFYFFPASNREKR